MKLRSLLAILVLSCSIVPSAHAEEEAHEAAVASKEQDAQYANWMTFYYLHKDPSLMLDYLAWLQYSGLLEHNETLAPSVSGFLSVVFSDNPSQVKDWVTSVSFTGRTRAIVQHALWLSGNTTLIKEAFKETPDYTKTPATGLLLTEPKIPTDLDMYWAAFSASGDVTYIRKVVDTLKEFAKPTLDRDKGLDLRAAAAWSLGANMAQHELAVREVTEELKTRPASIKIVLNDVLEKFRRSVVPFAKQDGDFSAALLITDAEGLEQYKKQPNKAGYVPTSTSVQRGKTVVVKIIFTGMTLTDDLQADVKFDLKVLSPDGTVYGNAHQEGLPALEGKVPSRFRIYNTASSLTLEFEPQDPSGVYKIQGEIRDNVGQKRVALEKELTLVD